MDQSTEVIQQHIEETRSRLTDNVEKLTKETADTVEQVAAAVTETVGSVQETAAAVTETVHNVSDSMQQTVKEVKHFLDIPAQVDRNPWLMLGGSIVAGYLAGSFLIPAVTSAQQNQEVPPSTSNSHSNLSFSQEPPKSFMESHQAEPSQEKGASWFSGLAETFAPAIDKLKGLAVSTALGLARDMVSKPFAGELGTQLHQLFDDLTTRLGGKPLSEETTASLSQPQDNPKGDSHEQRNEGKMDRSMGAGPREGQGTLGMANRR